MRQKKKIDDAKSSETEPQENCVKCSKLQIGGHCSFEEPEPPQKPSTALGSLKSVLKRSASHKKSSKEKTHQKELQVVRKQKNRVTFDESQNKYFDADYVILIHEEEYDFDDYYDEGSPYDDEDDEIYDEESLSGHNVCCSNPNCNNLITVSYPYAPGAPFLPKEHRYDFQAQQYYHPPETHNNSDDYDKCDNCDGCDEEYDVVPDYGDHVTLSPPEGYKDGGCCPHHGLQFHHPQPSHAAATNTHHPQDDASQRSEFFSEASASARNDQGQQATSLQPETEATPEVKQRFIVETITMTTVTERRIVREAEDVLEKKGGILKGGKFWRHSLDRPPEKSVNYNDVVDYKESDADHEVDEISTSFVQNDEEGNGNDDDDKGKGKEQIVAVNDDRGKVEEEAEEDGEGDGEETASPESTELTLTFKLGQHVLVANSLKPNSAVRQLFPQPRFMSPPPENEDDVETADNEKKPPKQFLVTAESLRLFEETKNSKILGNINEKESGQSFIAIMPPTQPQGAEDDDLRVRRTIERNTLRRSLIRYPCDLRSKRMAEKKKNENSLEERIRQLTCDLDDDEQQKNNDDKTMPARAEPQGEEAAETVEEKPLRPIESSSPSDNSSSSSSVGSTYKKITDVFARHSFPPPIREDVNCNIKSDLVAAHEKTHLPDNYTHFINPKSGTRISVTTEARKQFLSTLGPLTACVAGDGKEYSLEDIDAVLKTDGPKISAQPDIIAGTPQNETPGDELALFVQQDAGRIEKIKKRYSAADDKSDDEDDYGFNKRPQVKGIKPRFGTTHEIVQQIQENQTVWPYYSQGSIGYQQQTTGPRPQFVNRSPSVYSSNTSLYQCQPMRIGGGGGYPEIQNFHFRHPPQSPPPTRHRVNTPQASPNPEADARRHTDGLVRNPESVFYRRTVPNVHNPCVQMQFSPVGYTVPAASIRFAATCASQRPVVDESKVIIEPHYSTLPRPQVIRVGQGQQMIRVPVPYTSGTPVQVHLMARRCDSPQRPNSPQYLIAKGTQTAHHLPDGAPAVDFEAQGKAIADELQARQKLSRSMSQEAGYQVPRPIPRPHSPTCGRGVPEGAAASCSNQDGHSDANTVYYSMNV